VGYRSAPGAAREPWSWLERGDIPGTTPDQALQARLFESFFRGPWDDPWMAGAVVWKWEASTRRPEATALDFSPRGKLAEIVIRDAFSRP
jgi:hypothetical protein